MRGDIVAVIINQSTKLYPYDYGSLSFDQGKSLHLQMEKV